MQDIFISYAREDKEFVKLLAHTLEEEGWSVWWDRKIPTGRSFDEVIEEKIDAAKCVIVVWSRYSVESKWVRIEAGEGERRKILFPITKERADVPLAFRSIQAVNLVDWDGDTMAENFVILKNDIHRLFGNEEKVEAIPFTTNEEEKDTPPENSPPNYWPSVNPVGRWVSQTGYIVISESGNGLVYAEYNTMNYQTGQGSGYLAGNQLTLTGFNQLAGALTLNLTVTESQMSGTVTAINGASNLIVLNRY